MIEDYKELYLYFEIKDGVESVFLKDTNPGAIPVVGIEDLTAAVIFIELTKVCKVNGSTLKVIRFTNPKDVTEKLKNWYGK